MPAPRGISVRVPGPVSGLANRACRLPMVIPAFRWPVSPTVASWHAPTVAYRCGGSTGIRRPLGSAGVPTPEPVVPGQPAKDRGGSCSASGHPHLFPVEPLRRNRTGHPRTGAILTYWNTARRRESGFGGLLWDLGGRHFGVEGEPARICQSTFKKNR